MDGMDLMDAMDVMMIDWVLVLFIKFYFGYIWLHLPTFGDIRGTAVNGKAAEDCRSPKPSAMAARLRFELVVI
jgi:hypothetical protein